MREPPLAWHAAPTIGKQLQTETAPGGRRFGPALDNEGEYSVSARSQQPPDAPMATVHADDYRIREQPYYEPQGEEIEVFEAAYRNRINRASGCIL